MLNIRKVSKAYRSYRSEWLRMASWFGLPVTPKEEIWVLRNISFSVGAGEAIGIVGQNGAGKSTLLKIITGTLMPSSGEVQVAGRISAILELGMGFNPELTGRENARHSSGLMGFRGEQIDEMMPGILEFSELGDYFDQPLRTYSSGMQARLAFSVATSVRPEILIVDEALSVGDSYFQHKSFNRIREFREQGTTLLFVSHDANAVQSLCNRAILLEKGCVVRDGAPSEVMDYYNAIIAEKENATVEVKQINDGKIQTTSGTGEARIQDVGLFDIQGKAVEFVNVGQSVELRITAKIYQSVPQLVLGYTIKDRLGQQMFGTNTWHTGQVFVNAVCGQSVTYHIRFPANLGAGSYSVSVALTQDDTHLQKNYEWRDLALVFTVVNADKNLFVGSSWIEPKIEIEAN